MAAIVQVPMVMTPFPQPKPVAKGTAPRTDTSEVVYQVNSKGQWLCYRSPKSAAFINKDGLYLGYPPKGIPSERYYAYDKTIVAAATTYGIDPAFLKAILETESRFVANAKSRAGAEGVAQLMPDTARRLGVKNPFDPHEAIWGSAAHLRRTADLFRTANMVILASGYNAGDGAVEKTLKRIKGGINNPHLLDMVPHNKETPGYIQSVLWRFDRIHRGV